MNLINYATTQLMNAFKAPEVQTASSEEVRERALMAAEDFPLGSPDLTSIVGLRSIWGITAFAMRYSDNDLWDLSEYKVISKSQYRDLSSLRIKILERDKDYVKKENELPSLYPNRQSRLLSRCDESEKERNTAGRLILSKLFLNDNEEETRPLNEELKLVKDQIAAIKKERQNILDQKIGEVDEELHEAAYWEIQRDANEKLNAFKKEYLSILDRDPTS